MRTIFVLMLFLMHSIAVLNAEEVTSTTSITTSGLIVDEVGVNSISFTGTNAFDFSGDGIDDQELQYVLTIATSDGAPLTPEFNGSGDQTGNLDLDSNLSPILVTYSVEDIARLPGADPNFNYTFVSAEFLSVDVTINRASSLIFADSSAQTEIEGTSVTNFDFSEQGHSAAESILIGENYEFKISPETGRSFVQGFRHSVFTVDVTAVPEPGSIGLLAIGFLIVMRRRRQR